MLGRPRFLLVITPILQPIQHINYGMMAGLGRHDGDFTISAWIRPDDLDQNFYIMTKAGGSVIYGAGGSNDLHWNWLMPGRHIFQRVH